MADAAVTEIAFGAGYDSHEAFTRAFRAAYGCSPREFRAQRRSEPGAGCARPHQIEIAAASGLHFATLPDPGSIFFPALITKEGAMNVEIKTMPPMRTATLRHIGPYNRISEAFARLGEIAGRSGLLRTRPTMLAIYHDDPDSTPEAELRSDAAITILQGAPVPEGLVERQVAGGRYACAVHLGPYEQLGDAWARLMGRWLPESGQRIDDDGVSYEIYRNTPADVAPEKLVTELYVPLA
jgi:AraC family transcriptional regulator